MKRAAIFLDRDGTLNVDTGFTHRVEDLVLIDGVAGGLRRLAALGFQLFITTNQSGVARGLFSLDQMHAFNRALVARLAGEGIAIDGVYACPFHPTAGRGAFRRESPLRKPRPGLILQAAAEHRLDLPASYAIGDRSSDVAAGQAAGCRTILLLTGTRSTDDSATNPTPDFVAADLPTAAALVAAERAGGTEIPPRPASAYPLSLRNPLPTLRKRA